MPNLDHLFTRDNITATWCGYQFARVVGGALLRLLTPGPGRHRRPRGGRGRRNGEN
jgi:hypothetical protein